MLIQNVVYRGFAETLEVQSDVLVDENSCNEEFEWIYEERSGFPEEASAYKVEKRNLRRSC